jgi:hypothetical protein
VAYTVSGLGGTVDRWEQDLSSDEDWARYRLVIQRLIQVAQDPQHVDGAEWIFGDLTAEAFSLGVPDTGVVVTYAVFHDWQRVLVGTLEDVVKRKRYRDGNVAPL